MSTLTSPAFITLLERLYSEAEGTSPHLNTALGKLSEAELWQQMRSKVDYAGFYHHLKDFPLPIARDTGRLLYMLARSSNARSIVEFGTSFGLSTLHLAAALRDNGGGRLITSELEPSKAARAQAHLEAAGLLDLVEIREGDALQTLANGLPPSVDLLLLDGAKGLYGEILSLLHARLRPGALLIADNADYCPEYLKRVRSPAAGYLSVPFDDEVELSIKLA